MRFSKKSNLISCLVFSKALKGTLSVARNGSIHVSMPNHVFTIPEMPSEDNLLFAAYPTRATLRLRLIRVFLRFEIPIPNVSRGFPLELRNDRQFRCKQRVIYLTLNIKSCIYLIVHDLHRSIVQ